MSLRIKSDANATKISFVLPDDIHDGPVSAVGIFNDWVPGKHRLVLRRNSTRQAQGAYGALRQAQGAWRG